MEQARSGRPLFTVIGGPNGVGKSSYTKVLTDGGYPLGEVINPDVIAAALPGPDTTRDARAGRGNSAPHPRAHRRRTDVQP